MCGPLRPCLVTIIPDMEIQMPAYTKTEERPEKSQTREPAKGGLQPAHDSTYPSGDSPKPHGDPLRHVIADESTNGGGSCCQ